jgi:hypothetical protein
MKEGFLVSQNEQGQTVWSLSDYTITARHHKGHFGYDVAKSGKRLKRCQYLMDAKEVVENAVSIPSF